MAGLILLLISFLGYCLVFARYFRQEAETLPFFAVSLLISLLYLFGLTDILRPGAYFIFSLGLIFFIIRLFFFRKDSMAAAKELFAPGFVLFLLFAAAFWIKFRGAAYYNWDEFSHWGSVTLEIISRNGLIPPESALPLKEYPPAAALFHYYITLFTGYSEGNTYFAQALLLLAPAAALFQGTDWNKKLTIILRLTAVYLLFLIFGFKFQSLYIDQVLGIFFGMALASYFLSESRSDKTVLRLIPVVFVLPLLKTVGLLFGIITAAVVLADRSRHSINYLKTNTRANGRHGFTGKNIKYILLSAGILLLFCLAPVTADRSWNNRIEKLGINRVLNADFSFAGIRKSFSPDSATERDRTTISNFKRAFVKKGVGKIGIPPLIWVILFTMLFAGIFRAENRPPERFRVALSYVGMLAGFGIFSFGLLLLYLHCYGGYEGPRLASFGRYMSTFLFGWSFVALGFLARRAGKRGKHPIPSAALIAVLAAGIAAAAIPARGMSPLRRSIREKAAYINEHVGPDKRVYIIWQNTRGFQYWVFRYELAPRHVNNGAWTIGDPYYEEDVWTAGYSVQDWAEKLRDYDFVVIGGADDKFWERFGSLFRDAGKSRSGFLFEVKKGPGGQVSLELRQTPGDSSIQGEIHAGSHH